MTRLFQRAYHLFERIIKELKTFPKRCKAYGFKVAYVSFIDGIIPPGKSRKYIDTVGAWVDNYLQPTVEQFNKEYTYVPQKSNEPITVWCCWWQGETQMPDIVRMCHTRLKQFLPRDKAKLQVITLDNYKDFVDIPEHIVRKFEAGLITMATMSDVLRFALLNKYGGYWIDATVFFTDAIPEQYFSGEFFCQRMTASPLAAREACRCNWCGFSMAGPKGSPVFAFMCKAFDAWYKNNDGIIDYVLIDYMLWTGYQYVPAIKEIIDTVPDNNEDIFEMYKELNLPYSDDLLKKHTKRNVMHKLTYKMDLTKNTSDGHPTLYSYLWDDVFDKTND